MKKVLIALAFIFSMNQVAEAQLQFGVKAGVNYNSDSFSDVSNDVLNGAESRTGYHAGIWFRAKIPAIGLYLRPELVYTELKNNVNYTSTGSPTPLKTGYTFRKIDVPEANQAAFEKIQDQFRQQFLAIDKTLPLPF